MNDRADFKCSSCGRFLSWKEISPGGGASQIFVPDSYVSREELRYHCKKCTELYGKPLSTQSGIDNSKVSYIL